MTSENSSKARLGTIIALLGGAVGTGIVIYALMGQQPETVQDTTVPSGSDQTTKTESAAASTGNNATATTNDTTTASVEPAQTEPQATDEESAAPQETATATDVTSEAEAVVEPEVPAEAETANALPEAEEEPSQAENSAEANDTSQNAPAEETETTEATDDDGNDEAVAPEQPVMAEDVRTDEDAPVVAALDPVMPGNTSPVVLETEAEADDSQPTLDADDPSVPKFDLVRIEADGSAVIAGRAAPNSDVQIMSNGEEIGVVKASGNGEFVALLETEVNTTAQSLSLIATGPEAGKVTSQSNVIVLARTATETGDPNEEISLAPAIVEATRDEVRVIQPVIGLADLDRISLDTISYDEAGQVILAGRGRPNNTARIYADGTLLADRQISDRGTWSAEINELDAGRYVIRVDELDQSGEVLSRVESPFQRIFPSAEQLALLTDASSVIVQPGNNLWTIAEGRYGAGIRYTTIFEANKEQIRDPDLIYPGQVFELPDSNR